MLRGFFSGGKKGDGGGKKEKKVKEKKVKAKKSRWTQKEIEAYLESYERARTFHVADSRNALSISTTGLERRYGGSDTGITAAHKLDYDTRGMVHLGGDRTAADLYELRYGNKGIPSTTFRAFLGADEWSEFHEDPDEPSVRAFRTITMDIAPESLTSARLSTLSYAEKQHIFSKVLEHCKYNLQLGRCKTVDDVISLHEEALARKDELELGYVSD